MPTVKGNIFNDVKMDEPTGFIPCTGTIINCDRIWENPPYGIFCALFNLTLYVRFILGCVRGVGTHFAYRMDQFQLLLLIWLLQTSFRDKNGELVTPRQERMCHYHFRLDCIRAVEPNFVLMALQVPQDILPLLTVIHREYHRLVFWLTFQ